MYWKSEDVKLIANDERNIFLLLANQSPWWRIRNRVRSERIPKPSSVRSLESLAMVSAAKSCLSPACPFLASSIPSPTLWWTDAIPGPCSRSTRRSETKLRPKYRRSKTPTPSCQSNRSALPRGPSRESCPLVRLQTQMSRALNALWAESKSREAQTVLGMLCLRLSLRGILAR